MELVGLGNTVQGLFTPWTKKSWPCKICNWLLNSSQDHFGLHQGRDVIVTMESKVPKRHILRPTLSVDMVQRVLRWKRQKKCSCRKRQGPMARNCCYNRFLMNFFGGKEDEDKKREENGQN